MPARPASWRTIRNRWNQWGREVGAIKPKLPAKAAPVRIRREKQVKPPAVTVESMQRAAPELYAALVETLRALEAHVADEAKANGLPATSYCPCTEGEIYRARVALNAAKA